MTDINDFNYFKDTVQKFKSELQKMISGATYTNAGVIELKSKIDEIERNIHTQEKKLVSSYLKNNRRLKSSHLMMNKPSSALPQITQPPAQLIPYTPEDLIYTTLKYEKQSSLDRLKIARKQREVNEEKLQFVKNMKKRRQTSEKQMVSDSRRNEYYKNKKNNQILAKYNINSNFYDNLKVTTPMPNFMNTEKRLQYSVLNREYTNNKILYDEHKQPIIRKEELEKGLMNMINKGLIPKGADLSPAFETNGHPMQLNPKFKTDFEKTSNKDDYDTAAYEVSVAKKLEYENDGFFITKQPNILQKKIDNEPEALIEPINPLISEIEMNEESKELKEKPQKTEDIIQFEDKKYILFSKFKIVENEAYYNFYKANQDKWGNITYLFNHLSKLFKKLNIIVVEVSENKILQLARDETVNITNKDLLDCVSHKDLVANKLDPKKPIQFYATLKDKSALIIQMAFRMYIAKKKVKEIKGYSDKVTKLQNFFYTSKLIRKSQIKAKVIFNKRKEEWKTMMNIFKSKWEILKSSGRVEIHINSISLNSSNSLEMNTTFDKFNQRENLQLNRIMLLADENLEMIYISPYEISQDILAYYFSMLETLNVKNVRERFHLIVPDDQISQPKKNIKIPPYFSVSQKLLLSSQTLLKIKSLITDKEAFIVPGTVPGKFETLLSIQLEIPILMGDYEKTEAISTKYAAKLIFNKLGIPTPVSNLEFQGNITNSFFESDKSNKEENQNEVSDIQSSNIQSSNIQVKVGVNAKENFFRLLSMLITNYSDVEIWIFKMDYEYATRGLAFLQLEKLNRYIDYKNNIKDYQDRMEDYRKVIEDILYKQLDKRVKVFSNSLYKSWDTFLEYFLKYGGIIEACPVQNISKILGSPCVPFFIEPDGNIQILPTYDKINLFNFKCIGAISPSKLFSNPNSQDSSLKNEITEVVENLGKYLYERGIIGYATLELIIMRSDKDYNSNKYMAIDLKLGLNDILSSIRFCNSLYNCSEEAMASNGEMINGVSLSINNNLNEMLDNTNKYHVFTFPFFSHERIKRLRMSDLVTSFRFDKLIYDIEKMNGVIFNLSDVLQCGSMGLCGILNNDIDNSGNIYPSLWEMIGNAFYIVATAIKINSYFQLIVDEETRTDIIEFSDIYSKIIRDSKHIIKGAEKNKINTSKKDK